MYNYKSLKYADGTVETRFYSECILTGEKKKGESGREYDIEPFGGTQVEVVYDLEEFDRRAEESLRVSKWRTMQKIYAYARANIWDWFFTLTFNPDKVDRFDYGECQKKLTTWLNNMRKSFPELKYLFVPELHLGENSQVNERGEHAWHFHGLVSGLPDICFQESGVLTKSGLPIYNVGKYKLGWSTATRVSNQEACCKYITKYVTKDLCEVTKGRKRYWASKNLSIPEETTAILEYGDMQRLMERLLEAAISRKDIESSRGGKKTVTTYIQVYDSNMPERVSDARGYPLCNLGC